MKLSTVTGMQSWHAGASSAGAGGLFCGSRSSGSGGFSTLATGKLHRCRRQDQSGYYVISGFCHNHPPTNWVVSARLFDIRQLPRLVEQGLLWAVEAEEDFELAVRVGGNPVGILARRGFRAEVDIHRTIRVLLDSWSGGGAAGPLHIADESVRGAVVHGDRPSRR